MWMQLCWVRSKQGSMLKDVDAVVLGRVSGRKDVEGCGCHSVGRV